MDGNINFFNSNTDRLVSLYMITLPEIIIQFLVTMQEQVLLKGQT